jgi:hypothetical protein
VSDFEQQGFCCCIKCSRNAKECKKKEKSYEVTKRTGKKNTGG